MLEESIKMAIRAFVFEPNDANTWVRVKSMIESFLILKWRDGTFAGATEKDGFYVQLGLGKTMAAYDILNGKMNAEVGVALVKPAEFIVISIQLQMQES